MSVINSTSSVAADNHDIADLINIPFTASFSEERVYSKRSVATTAHNQVGVADFNPAINALLDLIRAVASTFEVSPWPISFDTFRG